MRVHVSETTYLCTKQTFAYKESAKIDVKGKGLMRTYFL